MDNNGTQPPQSPPMPSAPAAGSMPESPPDVFSQVDNGSPTTVFPQAGRTAFVQKIAGKNIYTSFLGVFVLLAGLAAGVVVVSHPQLLNQKASDLNNNTIQNCKLGLSCSESNVGGSTACTLGSVVKYCCPQGEKVAGSSCIPECGANVSCSTDPVEGVNCVSQTKAATNYCCAEGQSITDGKCVTK